MRFFLNKALIGSVIIFISLPCWGNGLDLFKNGKEAEKAGNWEGALEAYDKAIHAGDLTSLELSRIYFRRGALYGFLGNNINGIEDFSKSIELNQKRGGAYSLRGYLYGILGRYNLAEKDHETAIDLAKYEQWNDYKAWVLQHYADLWRRSVRSLFI